MWIKQILEWLFPGNQLKTLLQMIGVFGFMILREALRAKFRQRHGGSAVFFRKQRFQTLFGDEKEDANDSRR